MLTETDSRKKCRVLMHVIMWDRSSANVVKDRSWVRERFRNNRSLFQSWRGGGPMVDRNISITMQIRFSTKKYLFKFVQQSNLYVMRNTYEYWKIFCCSVFNFLLDFSSQLTARFDDISRDISLVFISSTIGYFAFSDMEPSFIEKVWKTYTDRA